MASHCITPENCQRKSQAEDGQKTAPIGPESRTDGGRAVYGGGGIAPDEVAKPAKITPAEAKLGDSIFAFALELASGRVTGFESYRVQKSIEFGHDLKAADFPVTDALFKELKRFAAAKPEFKATPEQLERARPFVERQLRFELATAAYGMMAALQVLNESDPQIARGVDACLAPVNVRGSKTRQGKNE